MKSLVAAMTRRSIAFAEPLAEAASEGAMNAVVIITRSSEPVFNDTTGELEMAASRVVYGPEGPEGGIAGIFAVSGPVTMALGDEPAYYSSTNVVIPQSAEVPRIDDVISVLRGDPDAIGRQFRVVDVEVGKRLRASIHMQAMGVAPSRQWGPESG